jgi:hypothetical protein
MNIFKPADTIINLPQTMPDPRTLTAHPIAAEFPLMDRYEYEGLKASMKSYGFREDDPIWLYEGQILDGRNRLKAALEVGIALSAKNFRVFTGTHAEAQAFSNRKNGHRRHLTQAQKDDRVRAYVLAHPHSSSREVAKACGVSHTHVMTLKKDMSAGPMKTESLRSSPSSGRPPTTLSANGSWRRTPLILSKCSTLTKY